MKSLVIGSILAVAAFTATAAEVSVGGAYDYTANQGGTRVAASAGQLGPIKPTASVTHINDVYTRYAVGGEAGLFKVGPVAVGATAAGVYQATAFGENGYGATIGVKATYDVTKNVAIVGGVERFFAQDRIKAYEGNVATVGVSYKF